MTKQEVIERICDRGTSFDEIRRIDIDDFVNVIKGKTAKGFYGVNVRLKSSSQIMPFIKTFKSSTGFDPIAIARAVDKDHTVPALNKKFRLSELFFRCYVDESHTVKDIEFLDRKLTLGKSELRFSKTDEDMKTWLRNAKSILSVNVRALGYQKKTVYVWITGEDYDPADEGRSFLSNILAICDNKDLIDAIRAKHADILYFLFLLKARYLADMDAERRKAAEQSAKAAIMSRNMSHNLGSHVMAYLKQKLGSVTTILSHENDVLADLYPHHLADMNSENLEMPFLVGLGKFIGYLQERQDYIATISTDYIPYGAPVNLKDAIYDELNPDLRYLRHKVDNPTDANNRPTNILLNYIAKSENLSRENFNPADKQSDGDIRFGFIDYTPDGGARTFGFEQFDSQNEALSKMRGINFSLPGGLVGRQALFSVFENLIRNAAKHGDTSSVKNLDFTIDVIDGASLSHCTAWEKRIGDSHWRSLYENASDISDVSIITITDNLPCSQVIVDNLQQGLYEAYVDDVTGKMTTANKGIKEIRISSAWLRGETDEDRYARYDRPAAENVGKLAPLVGVELSPEGNLRYMICVRKNKTVAIVREVKIGEGAVSSIDEASLNIFEQYHQEDADGWFFIDEDELLKSKSSFSFILIPDAEEAYNRLRPMTSNRLLRWKAEEANLNAFKKGRDEALIRIYQLFTGLNDESAPIYIDDPKARNEEERRSQLDNAYQISSKICFDVDPTKIDTERPFYLYKTHLATKKDYINFVGTQYTALFSEMDQKKMEHCVEGISGDNSSDRLVRREPLNDRWYYTHLYAFQKRVAIIDERLFKMVHNINESQFFDYDGEISIDDILKTIQENQISEDDQKKVLELINDRMDLYATDFEDVKGIDELIPLSLVGELVKSPKSLRSVNGACHLTPYFQGKGVSIFTVIGTPDGKMILVGNVSSSYDEKNGFDNQFEQLAAFERNDQGGYRLEPVEKYKDMLEQQFDFISIHQGILDKVYEKLDIKQDKSEKCKLTACIHHCLMKDNQTIGDYLPRFIIHSGRAKPTEEDMPQKQPFIQYAAIENAVKDCKTMLVELLDYAKYESN